MYYMTEVDAHYHTNLLLLVIAPVGKDTAYSDVLHCAHGGQGCTTIAWKWTSYIHVVMTKSLKHAVNLLSGSLLLQNLPAPMLQRRFNNMYELCISVHGLTKHFLG